jgi:hypothetical protein
MTDEFETYDAAYLLGALSEDERRRYEDHLLVCDTCAESIRSLRRLPALLATVPPDVLEEEVAADPPANLLPTLLERVRRSHRRRRLVTAAVVAVAAACVVVALVLAWPSSNTAIPPTPNPAAVVAMAAPSGESVGVEASARIQTVRWGTRIDLSCHQIAGGAYAGNAPYQLVVVDRSGSTQTLGTWNLPTGRDITFTGGTSLPADHIQEVKVTTLSGEDLLIGRP